MFSNFLEVLETSNLVLCYDAIWTARLVGVMMFFLVYRKVLDMFLTISDPKFSRR